ncbi:MFS transporter [Amycolatopsis sp. DSM 110486]|uniref:MFS transporter n=1 Tax=Amycolatopsis sp. DSM 110486 TaxID=2865832 RepID=UPI001C695704|nr:MFS transporter [Amycolatopsis sp. DSM 110486]QYN20470.1 MHS family MFS transporter [Amycolatopsis sp. DSM 110486]
MDARRTPAEPDPVDGGKSPMRRRVVAASIIGSALEWYDYALYGLASALVLNKLFFPDLGSEVGTIASVATFAVGFVARPLGGVVLGNLGDRHGRKAVMITTLVLMGIATTLIGALPTYGSIGVWAPILLVFLRLCQGFGAGAEFGGAVVMSAEYAPPGKRGLFASTAQVGAEIGMLLSTAAFAVIGTLPENQLLSWGWRIPFLVGIVPVAVGLFLRLRVQETPEFQRVKGTGEQPRVPMAELLRTAPKQVLLAAGARLMDPPLGYLYTVFVTVYAVKQVGVAQQTVLTGLLIASALGIGSVALFGHLTDRLGTKRVYLTAAAFAMVLAFPFYWLVDTGQPVVIWLALILGTSVGKELNNAGQAAYLTEMFEPRIRVSGVSLARESVSAVGGLIRVAGLSLVNLAGGSYWPVALLMVVLGAISFVCISLSKPVVAGANDPDATAAPAYAKDGAA